MPCASHGAAPLGVRSLLLLGCLAVFAACTSNGPAGGPVSGPVDNHCFVLPDGGFPGGSLSTQATAAASCNIGPDAGTVVPPLVYGPTNYNAQADDDDCKYQVGFWSTPVQQQQDVTFYVSAIKAVDGTPLAGASTLAEVYLANNHPAPNSGQATTEVSPGVYKVGPIRFDAAGQWTVRFHFDEQCFDTLASSPHGHAAFFVNVP